LAVTYGNTSALPPDRLWSVSLDGALPARVFESTEGYALSAVLADSANGRALLADGTKDHPSLLRIFTDSQGSFAAGPTVGVNPSQKLPLRTLAFY